VPADAVKVLPDIIIEEADHLQAQAFQVCGALGIMAPDFPGVVALTVKLDNQTRLRTVEVNDVLADWPLPPEADRVGTQEIIPEMLFLPCHGPAKGAGLIAAGFAAGKAGHCSSLLFHITLRFNGSAYHYYSILMEFLQHFSQSYGGGKRTFSATSQRGEKMENQDDEA
jgi:hypothetical protein